MRPALPRGFSELAIFRQLLRRCCGGRRSPRRSTGLISADAPRPPDCISRRACTARATPLGRKKQFFGLDQQDRRRARLLPGRIQPTHPGASHVPEPHHRDCSLDLVRRVDGLCCGDETSGLLPIDIVGTWQAYFSDGGIACPITIAANGSITAGAWRLQNQIDHSARTSARRFLDDQSIMPCDGLYNVLLLWRNLRLHPGLRQWSGVDASYAVTLAIWRWHEIEWYCC